MPLNRAWQRCLIEKQMPVNKQNVKRSFTKPPGYFPYPYAGPVSILQAR